MTEAKWYERHRGPYTFNIVRPGTKKKCLTCGTSEWLAGKMQDGADVEAQALALLHDPRDTISSVHVFSETEQQFVMGYSRREQDAV